MPVKTTTISPRPLLRTSALLGGGLLLGISSIALQGCEEGDSPLSGLAEKCGLVCPTEGIAQGNASISGLASVDSFFGAVVDFTAAADGVDAKIRAELDAIALGLGLPEGAAAGEIRTKIEERLMFAVAGGLQVKYQEPKCEASVEVAASAAASCDAEVDPGSVQVQCQGSCDIDASAQADCQASGTLTCVGQAPNLQCEGSCTGTCELMGAATCDGTCRGTCTGECTVLDSQGNCAGACDGNCQGECELSAGGMCNGKCQGECEYTPPGGMCDANVKARCEAMVEANVECKGGCEGEATPPMVKAECEATVEAKAKASVECTPPSVEITWQWSATIDGDLQAQANFRAWVNSFRGQLAGLLAATAKAKILADLAVNLAGAAEGAVQGSIEDLSVEADLKTSIGAGCALLQLPDAVNLINAAGGQLTASVTASGEVFAAIGG
ncbi:MAG: hypothetical protein KC486_00195 [Myxococcales bacterium]|nr:hypothetical protein [Myxococcales bacterium]